MPGFDNIFYHQEIAQGFRHLFLVDVDKAVVHPVPGKRFSESRL